MLNRAPNEATQHEETRQQEGKKKEKWHAIG